MPATRNWTSALLGGGLLAVALLAALPAAQACETPVYRYAMYRWTPAPYEVYFFHDQPAGDEHREVARLIAEASEGSENRANIVYVPVNLAEDTELAGVPPDVKQAWTQREDKTLPSYLVSTPYGVEFHSGALQPEAIALLIESPARKQLARQLEAGKIGVFVLVAGADEAQNQLAEKILQELTRDVAAGKVPLYAPPTAGAPQDDVAAGDPPVPQELGIIQVDRHSETEKWFVRALLAMEPDLPAEQQPMVFLTYGRARALLPYIGKGITRENLIREVEFISGACSCTVKEQNPGVDLLVRYDWESAAATLAERFGSEEGNETQFGPDEFFPELIIPSSGSPPAVADAGDEQDTVAADVDEPPGETDAVPAETEPTQQTAPQEDPPATDAGLADAASPPDLASDEPAALESQFSLKSVLIVGGGIAAALIVLFGLTFLVMRPQ